MNKVFDCLIRFKSDSSELTEDLNAIQSKSDKISTDLGGKMKEAVQGISQLSELTGKSSFESAPVEYGNYMESMLSAMREQVLSIVSDIKNTDMRNVGQDVVTALQQRVSSLLTNISESILSTQTMNSITGKLGADFASQLSSNFTDIYAEVNRRVTQTIGHLGPLSDRAYNRMMMSDKSFASALHASQGALSTDASTMQDMVNLAVRMQQNVFRRDYLESLEKHSGGLIRAKGLTPSFQSYQERLPELYQGLETNPVGNTKQTRGRKDLKGNLSPAQYAQLRKSVAQNSALEQALIMSGVAFRGSTSTKAGELFMPDQPISKMQLAKALGFLHRDILVPALEGTPEYYRKIDSREAKDAERIANSNTRDAREAFEAFQTVAPFGVMPVYSDRARKIQGSRNHYSPVENAHIKARPEAYQIMSLTYGDFLSGVKLNPKGETQGIYDDKPAGKSVNKMIQESGYTRLAGLHGHNTLGNGSKTDYGKPGIIQIDFSNDLFEKDEDGELVWENGVPKQNQKTAKDITNLFTKRATIKGADIGPGAADYGYPRVPYGSNGYYVPTNGKNGKITLIPEETYIANTIDSLRATGLGVYENWVDQGAQYEKLETLNKQLEGRNRQMTPSVPIERLGGRLPSSKKIAFVDMKSLTGHDGSSFFMPGYIPGENATFRVGGMKGLAQSVDYKQMIRDLYGVNEFYMPALNAPEDVRELFRTQGIGAVREKLSKEDFNKYFLDIMKYDALIADSVIKTPMYQGKTNAEAQKIWRDTNASKLQFGIVQTADQFLTSKSSLGRQMSQALDLNEEQLKANDEAWDKHINTLLRDPVATANMLFGDPYSSLDARVRQDPGLIWREPEARRRYLQELQSSIIARSNEEIYGRGLLMNTLAATNPAEQILKVGAMNGLKPVNEDLAKQLSLGEDVIAAGFLTDKADERVGGGRWPATPGEQYDLTVSSDYLSAGRKYGLARNVAYVNTNTIAKMGGGDVDGDTIQILRRRLQQLIQDTYTSRKGKTGTRNQDLKPEDIIVNRPQRPGDMADLLYRSAASAIRLGQVSNAQDALQQINWNDPQFVKQYGSAAADLAMLYDIDSTYLKTGVLGTWTGAAKRASGLGRPFSHLFNNLVGSVQNNDFSRLGDFSKVNFPSRYHGLTTSMLASIAKNPLSTNAFESLISAQADLQGLPSMEKSSDPVLQARAAFLQKNNEVFAKFLTRGAKLSSEDEDVLNGLLGSWGNTLRTEETRPGISAERKEELRKQRSFFNEQQKRIGNIPLFGIGEKYEDGYMPLLSESPLTSATSVFKETLDAAMDAQKAQTAVWTGGNVPTVQAHQQWAANSQIAEAEQRANEATYSYTQLRLFDENRQKWYDRYIRKIPEETGPEAQIGNAIDATLGEWAEKKLAAQKGTGAEASGDDLASFFESEIRRSFEKGIDQSSPYYKRYQNALNYAKGLPELLKDEEVLEVTNSKGEKVPSYQVEVRPDIGERPDNRGKLKTFGAVDVQTRNKNTGLVTAWDLKPSLFYKGVEDQLQFYMGDPAFAQGVDQMGVLAYNDPNGSKRIVPKVQENIENTRAKMRSIFDNRYLLAEAGDTWEALDAGIGLPGVFDREHVMEFLEHQNNSAAERVRHQEDIAKASGENRAVMDKKTGISIAKAMSLQQDITAYTTELEEMASQLSGKIYRRDHDGLKNPWAGYRYALDEGFRQRREDLIRKGAKADEDLVGLDEQQRQAELIYKQALHDAAIGENSDITQAIKNFDDVVSNRYGNKHLNSFAKDFEEIDKYVERASQSLNEFKAEISGKELTPEDQNLLNAREAEFEALKMTVGLHRQRVSDELSKSVEKDIRNAEVSQTGDKLSLSEVVENAKNDRFLDITKTLTSLDSLSKKGYITEQDYTKWSDRLTPFLDETSLDAYGETIVKKQQDKTEKELKALQTSYSKNPFASIVSGADKAREKVNELIDALAEVYAAQDKSNDNKETKLANGRARAIQQYGNILDSIDAKEQNDILKKTENDYYKAIQTNSDITGETLDPNHAIAHRANLMREELKNFAQYGWFKDVFGVEGNDAGIDQLTSNFISTEQGKLKNRDILRKNENDYRDSVQAIQNDAELRSQREQYDKYWRQRRRRMDNSAFGRLQAQDEERRYALREQESSLINKRDIEQAKLDRLNADRAATTKPEDQQKLDQQIKETTNNLQKYKQEIANVQQEQTKMESSSLTFSNAFETIGHSVSRAATQFGRQMFNKAISEVKKFVQEYDASMAEIQMITLQSDGEISELGKNLIGTAVDMKASVKDVTSTAAALYRQGLSDEEVDTRLEDVIKFSKVAGISSTDATKIITTAMQNGLVDSSEQAMDALVALGDSAATTAAEISKGIQKSAASAKEAGVSYDELVTMLTIITSKTQLGGASAGTALQTLMYRLYKVQSGEEFYDENGNMIANTKATQALRQAGVSIYDENGNMRGAYDILTDLSAGWENLNDTQQSMILSTLGAGRQRTNIATLLQGLGEDNGELAKEYMNLASGSKGITDKKYDVYLDTLGASIEAVQGSFDQLIASFDSAGTGSGFLNFIAEIIQGFTTINEVTDGVAGKLTGILAIVGGIAALIMSNPVIAGLTLAIGGGAAIIGGIGSFIKSQQELDAQSKLVNGVSYTQNAQNTISTSQKSVDSMRTLIEDTEALIEKRNNGTITNEEQIKLDANIEDIQSQFGYLGDSISGLGGTAEQAASALQNLKKEQEQQMLVGVKNGAIAARAQLNKDYVETLDKTTVSSSSAASFIRDLNAQGTGGTYDILTGGDGKSSLGNWIKGFIYDEKNSPLTSLFEGLAQHDQFYSRDAEAASTLKTIISGKNDVIPSLAEFIRLGTEGEFEKEGQDNYKQAYEAYLEYVKSYFANQFDWIGGGNEENFFADQNRQARKEAAAPMIDTIMSLAGLTGANLSDVNGVRSSIMDLIVPEGDMDKEEYKNYATSMFLALIGYIEEEMKQNAGNPDLAVSNALVKTGAMKWSVGGKTYTGSKEEATKAYRESLGWIYEDGKWMKPVTEPEAEQIEEETEENAPTSGLTLDELFKRRSAAKQNRDLSKFTIASAGPVSGTNPLNAFRDQIEDLDTLKEFDYLMQAIQIADQNGAFLSDDDAKRYEAMRSVLSGLGINIDDAAEAAWQWLDQTGLISQWDYPEETEKQEEPQNIEVDKAEEPRAPQRVLHPTPKEILQWKKVDEQGSYGLSEFNGDDYELQRDLWSSVSPTEVEDQGEALEAVKTYDEILKRHPRYKKQNESARRADAIHYAADAGFIPRPTSEKNGFYNAMPEDSYAEQLVEAIMLYAKEKGTEAAGAVKNLIEKFNNPDLSQETQADSDNASIVSGTFGPVFSEILRSRDVLNGYKAQKPQIEKSDETTPTPEEEIGDLKKEAESIGEAIEESAPDAVTVAVDPDTSKIEDIENETYTANVYVEVDDSELKATEAELDYGTKNQNATSESNKLFSYVDQTVSDYENANATKVNMDQLYAAMSSAGVTDLASFFAAVNNGTLGITQENLGALMQSNSATGYILNKYMKRDENGDYLTDENGLPVFTGDVAAGYREFVQAILSNSSQYSGVATAFDLQRMQAGAAASTALSSIGQGAIGMLKDYDQAAVRSIIGDQYAARWELANATGNTNPFSADEIDYMNMLASNAQLGVNGLLAYQKSAGANILYNQIKAGTLGQYLASNGGIESQMIQNYSSNLQGFEEIASYQQQLEKSEIGMNVFDIPNIEEGTDAWDSVKTALKLTDDQMKALRSNVKKLDASMKSGTGTFDRYGDEADKVKSSFEQWSGDAASAAQAQKNLNQTIASGSTSQMLLENWQKGNKKKSDVASLLGVNKNQLNNMGDQEIERQLQLQVDVNEQDALNQINGEIESVISDLGAIPADIPVEAYIREDGTIDSTSLAALAAEANNEAAKAIADIVASLQKLGATVTWEAVDTGDGVAVQATGVSFSGKGGGGGGGGGGGKSAADTAIDNAKNSVLDEEHNATMANKYTSRMQKYGNLNDQLGAYDDEIAAQEKLKKAYQGNVSALQAQLAGVEEGSEDYYKIVKAINEYLEKIEDCTAALRDLRNEQYKARLESANYRVEQQGHDVTMMGSIIDRYGNTSSLASVSGMYQAQNGEIDEQIKAEKKAMNEAWKGMQNNKKGSAAWEEFRKAYEEAQEQIASLQAQKASNQAAIRQNQRTTMQNRVASYDHANSLSQIAIQRYGNRVGMGELSSLYKQNNGTLKDQISARNDYIKLLRKQQNSSAIEEGSAEWWQLEAEINSLTEANAQAKAQIDENTIAMQKAKENLKAFNTAIAEASQQLYSTFLQRYENRANMGQMDTLLDEDDRRRKATITRLKQERALKLEDLYSGKYAQGSAEYQQYVKDIAEIDNKIATEQNAILDNEDTRRQNREYLREQRDDYSQFQLDYIEKSLAANKGSMNYAGINIGLAQQNAIRRNNVDNLKGDLTALKKEQKDMVYGSKEWYDVAKQIEEKTLAILDAEAEINDTEKQMIENQRTILQNQRAQLEHNVNMIQYEQTRYANNDELTNVNTMIEKENKEHLKELDNLREEKALLEARRSTYEKHSPEWEEDTAAINKLDEEVAKLNNTIDQNNKKIEENNQKILKYRTNAEDMIRSQIEANEKRDKEILAARVNMENTILNAIKRRYQDEWDLRKRDIAKKKQDLQEELAMIDTRLQRRKEAEDEAERYEELAELKRQLAMIEMDSTRTKDAKALREQINSIEKDISWDIAADEANTEKEGLQEQISAYDSYVTAGDEDLSRLLEDANNFADEVNQVMKMSHDDLVLWLQQNDEAYKLGLDDLQQQLTTGWGETWETMNNYIDNHQEKINELLKSEQSMVEFLMASTLYTKGEQSEATWGQLLYNWSDVFSKMTNSAISSSEAENYKSASSSGWLKQFIMSQAVAEADENGLIAAPENKIETLQDFDMDSAMNQRLLAEQRVEELKSKIKDAESRKTNLENSEEYRYFQKNPYMTDKMSEGQKFMWQQGQRYANEIKGLGNNITSLNEQLKTAEEDANASSPLDALALYLKSNASSESYKELYAYLGDKLGISTSAAKSLFNAGSSNVYNDPKFLGKQGQTTDQMIDAASLTEIDKSKIPETLAQDAMDEVDEASDHADEVSNSSGKIKAAWLKIKELKAQIKELEDQKVPFEKSQEYQFFLKNPVMTNQMSNSEKEMWKLGQKYANSIKEFDEQIKSLNKEIESQQSFMANLGIDPLQFTYEENEYPGAEETNDKPNSSDGTKTPASTDNGNDNGSSPPATEASKKWKYETEYDGHELGGAAYASEAKAEKAAATLVKSYYDTRVKAIESNYPVNDPQRQVEIDAEDEYKAAALKKPPLTISSYLQGGLVKYTGPAWVDGTKQRPEAFLDAADTKLMRSMLDAMNYVTSLPTISRVNQEDIVGGDGFNIESLSVAIYEAEFKDDADYAKVAKRIGNEFVKELARSGLHTTRFSF